jgi:hypothetical protein
VTEAGPGQGRTGREPLADGSRSIAPRIAGFRAATRSASGFALALTAAGLIAGLLLVITEFTTIASVEVASGSCEVINDSDPALADRCSLSGFERHGGAFILLGLMTAAMAWGAGIGVSRPAGVALLAIGVLVIVLSLALDLPQTDKTGAIGRNFEGASAKAGLGLYLELVAGVLAAGAGVAALTRRRD